MKYNWKKIGITAFFVLLLVGAVSVSAAQGDENDPLVTLSYLKNVFTSSVLTETQKQTDTAVAEYEQKADALVQEYQDQIQSSGGEDTGTFAVVSLSSGQTLCGDVGCEIMLRVGSAVCVSPSSPGLIDSTSGGTLDNGAALVKNHLYLFTISDRSVKASNSVKVLVRGSYTVQ